MAKLKVQPINENSIEVQIINQENEGFYVFYLTVDSSNRITITAHDPESKLIEVQLALLKFNS